MKKILLGLGLLFFSASVHAGSDRFGNQRAEVSRSSYTEVPSNPNVVLASATQNLAGSSPIGGVIIRSVIFGGVNPATMTFYDANLFDATTSTKTKLPYIPVIGGSGVTGLTSVDTNMFFSSAAMYNLNCTAPCPVSILWDYTTAPPYGDARK